MPTYQFRNKKTGEENSVFFQTIAEAEQFEKDHPEFEWLCSAPAIGDSFRLGLRKPDDAFRDRLKDIKKSHYKSNINTF